MLASLVAARRERNRRFANAAKLFADPAWDILVDLLDSGMRGIPVSVTGACVASGVPLTTALRYIRLLEQEGLISRGADEDDGRRVFLSITVRGWSEMRAYAAWLSTMAARIGEDHPEIIRGARGGAGRTDAPSSARTDR